ncbi:Calcium-binding protein OS=Streptomyces antimycoticus OX=68175 GN=SANT12839_059050 PE=4 SV=1 [Streptomyces antimycoticus]
MRMYRTMAAAATLALALGGAALAAPAAQAAATTSGSLVHEDGELWYKAAAGQKNNLSVSEQIVSRGEFEEYYVLDLPRQR